MVVRDGCAAATAQEHDTCMDLVFPRMAWVASVDDVINAIRGDHSGETAGSTPFGESWMVSVPRRGSVLPGADFTRSRMWGRSEAVL